MSLPCLWFVTMLATPSSHCSTVSTLSLRPDEAEIRRPSELELLSTAIFISMMNLRGPGRSRQTRLPPGATGPTRSANSDTSRHPLPSLAAVMSAPERQNMPHRHPQKLNGSLWFDRHDCIRKDIVASWQADFRGPWWKYSMCPQHKKDAWWTSFVQNYYWKPEVHDMVLACWQKELDKSIRNLVFKRKWDAKKPPYIGLADWGLMQDAWKDLAFLARSKINSKNKRSDPDGLGTPCHTSGAKRHS